MRALSFSHASGWSPLRKASPLTNSVFGGRSIFSVTSSAVALPTFVAVTVVLNCRPATTSSDDALISTLTSGPLLPKACVATVQLREAVEELPTSSVA